MTEPDPTGQTLPVGSQSSSDDTKDPVEAGLRAVFEEEPGDSLVDSPRSVVELLGDIDVALKVLLEEHQKNPERLRRFVEEAQRRGDAG